MYGSSIPLLDLAKQTALIISNEEMEDIMKIVKSFDKQLVKQLKMKQKTKKRISFNVIRNISC